MHPVRYPVTPPANQGLRNLVNRLNGGARVKRTADRPQRAEVTTFRCWRASTYVVQLCSRLDRES